MDHGLVDKNVAVGEIKNLLFATGLVQAFDNLESRIGFACTRRHREQYSLLAFRDRLNRAVDRNTLVVTGCMRVRIPVVWLVDDGLLFRGEFLY